MGWLHYANDNYDVSLLISSAWRIYCRAGHLTTILLSHWLTIQVYPTVTAYGKASGITVVCELWAVVSKTSAEARQEDKTRLEFIPMSSRVTTLVITGRNSSLCPVDPRRAGR